MGCVNCHHTDKAFTDGIAHSIKDSGKQNSRNSPTMYNVGYYPELYWDGRKVGLESNVLDYAGKSKVVFNERQKNG